MTTSLCKHRAGIKQGRSRSRPSQPVTKVTAPVRRNSQPSTEDGMISKKFLQAGHFPTLMAAFLYFDVSFMVWVLLGPLAPFLGEQMHLTATQKGLLTAIPLLGGSLF